MPRGVAVDRLVRQVQAELVQRARPAVARQAQSFFKDDDRVPIRGVRAAEVQRIAASARKALRQGQTSDALRVAERLLASRWLEDKIAAVYVASRFTRKFGPAEFHRSERWLGYVTDWASCDGLSTAVLGPQLVTDGKRMQRTFLWAQSKNRWCRRAAAVSLIPAARQGLYTRTVFRLARRLYRDPDDMVQKGVGWLLKETSKARRPAVVSFLLGIKKDAPRLVLRYASEKLPREERRRVLA